MNDVVDVQGGSGATPPKSQAELDGLKNVTMVVYVLQALSFLWGVTAIAGVIVNYVKRDDVKGTLYESHFDWQIRTFWWMLVWGVVGCLLIFALGLGFLILGVAWLWAIYRVVKGWLKLTEGKPVFPA
jgi:uncharacterized membrane protein